ncbi:MAG TPA: response regulator [Pyrinomonadaceae bacterium]|nr:response regulator [Pyrinomonadaceae bacterium]
MDGLSPDERALLRCRLVRRLEERGDYEEASAVLGELWPRVGERPAVEGLADEVAAEVLQQAGVLTSSLGSAKQIEWAQETAKNLLSESVEIFQRLGAREKALEAHADLALCYWRNGSFDEARHLLRRVLNCLGESNVELAAAVLLRSAMVERTAKRIKEALQIHLQASPLFERIDNHTLRGKFHGSFALVLRDLGTAENRPDYIDRALIEYSAASYHFEQAGHERYCARVENNLGYLFSTIGKFAKAHEHVRRARALFVRLKDEGSIAQVDDTAARVLLAEGRAAEAEEVARAAVRTLEKGGEQALLAEVLTTHGVALARTCNYEDARLALQRAVLVAERAGDREGAGQAALTIIEELCEQTTPDELGAVYRRATFLLSQSQHPSVPGRLVACAGRVLERLASSVAPSRAPARSFEDFRLPSGWDKFSFRAEVNRYESFLIERALRDSQGVVTRASQLLGFNHYQSLLTLLQKRHNSLTPVRSPIYPRKRSIVRVSARAPRGKSAVTILHAEDNPIIADALRETFESEGWRVETCAEGTSALARIEGEAHFDLLLFDYDMPGLDGLELTRRVRALAHRSSIPVVMLSAHDCETEALRAGVNLFLRKPEAVQELVETVARLIGERARKP